MPRRTFLPFAAVALAATLPLQGCFLPFLQPKVTTEYDHSAPLARRTYSWGGVRMEMPQYAPTVRAAVDKDLQKRGWQLAVTGGSATVFAAGGIRGIGELEADSAKQNGGWAADQWGLQGLGPGWKPTYGEATINALGTAESHLVVDIFDTGSRRLLFRGVGPDRLSNTEKKNNKGLEESVKLMFKKFPPKS